MEELGSSQSSGTEQGVLFGKRDDLMRLLARQELMMMMIPVKTAAALSLQVYLHSLFC